MDQEKIASIFSKYDFLALPVVDKENRIVGIVTVDDVIDVINEETTEDFEKMAAVHRLYRADCGIGTDYHRLRQQGRGRSTRSAGER